MREKKINLLPKKDKSLDEKIVYFGLHYLRYILVLTQIIVLVVFFYRFKVDQEIIDLKEQVEERKEIISVAKSMLADASIISAKSKNVRMLLNDQKQFDERIDKTFAYVPRQLVITSAIFSEKKTYLEGYSPTDLPIKIFYERLMQVFENKVTMKSIVNNKGVFTFKMEF